MEKQLTRRHILLAGAAATLGTPRARAQAGWPSKPVTIVVPFPPGGGTDDFARPLFALMSKNTGRQFVIDNKGGAGGTLGAGIAARAAPDGYTFFMGAVHHAIAPSVYPKLDYNIETDFVPIGLVSSVPQVIVIVLLLAWARSRAASATARCRAEMMAAICRWMAAPAAATAPATAEKPACTIPWKLPVT